MSEDGLRGLRQRLYLDCKFHSGEADLWFNVIRVAVYDYHLGIPEMDRDATNRERIDRRFPRDAIRAEQRRQKNLTIYQIKKKKELRNIKLFLFNKKAEPFNLAWICNHLWPDNDKLPELLRRHIDDPAEWWFA